jgi:glycosyltransferase involved in cell wall biosynthesis
VSATPVVSVVIATRNRRHLLSETIATVQDQTLGDWELIVVDDASTDDTMRHLETMDDQRVVTLRQEVHGERSAARNAGLAAARGEFVMFLDDDDLLRPSALDRLVRALRAQPDALAASGACRILQRNGDSVKVYRPADEHTRVIWRELLFGWWSNSGQNLYRTATIRDIGGFDPALAACEDRRMWLAVARRGPVRLVPSVVMEYRQHDGQSKPSNVDAIRQSVWRDFITGLPPADQRAARRVRRAAELVERAESARVAGRFVTAITLQLQACWLAPHLLRSPLTGRPFWWGLKKSLLRVRAL